MKKFFLFILLMIVLGGAALYLRFQKSSTNTGCPFCKEERLNGRTFYESEYIRGFPSRQPTVPGHVLLIPKRHVERIEDLNQEEWIELKEAIRKTDLASKKVFGNPAYLLLQKNGAEAGQAVPHVHIHYFPRFKEVGHVSFAARHFLSHLLPPKASEELELTAQQLADEIARIPD